MKQQVNGIGKPASRKMKRKRKEKHRTLGFFRLFISITAYPYGILLASGTEGFTSESLFAWIKRSLLPLLSSGYGHNNDQNTLSGMGVKENLPLQTALIFRSNCWLRFEICILKENAKKLDSGRSLHFSREIRPPPKLCRYTYSAAWFLQRSFITDGSAVPGFNIWKPYITILIPRKD